MLALAALAALLASQGGDDIASWSGFRYLHGHPGVLTSRAVPILHAVSPVNKTGATRALKVHVAISTKRFGYLGTSQDAFNPIAMFLDEGDVSQIKSALADAVNDIDVETVADGVHVRLTTSIEAEPIVATRAIVPQLPRSSPHWIISTFANAGRFVSDDHVDRGPFDVILWVHPGPNIETDGDGREIGIGAMPSRGRLAYILSSHIRRVALGDLFVRPARADIFRPLAAYLRGGSATDLIDRHDRSPNQRRAQLKRSQSPIYELPPDPNITAEVRTIDNATVGLSTSTDGVPYLRISETRLAREAWVGLPELKPESSAKSLTIRLRSTTPERMNVVCQSGRETPVVTDLSMATGPDGPFRFDGAWHTITCPLPTDRSEPIGVAIAAPDMMSHTGAPVIFDIASIDVSTELATKPARFSDADPALPGVQLAAMEKFLSAGKFDAARAALTSPSEYMKACMLEMYLRYKDPDAVEAIANQASSINPAVAAMALAALAHQGTDEAIAALRKHARASLTEIARGIALHFVSNAKDQVIDSLAEPFLLVRSPSARFLATLALHRSKSTGARRLLAAFLLCQDQEVKRMVTLGLDDPNPEEIKKLTWSAINEPFDEVRAYSYLMLAQSKDPDAHAEGLKVAFDESWAARSAFYWAIEDWKTKLLGLKDRDWAVRCGVIGSLSMRTEPVSWADLSDLLQEEDPDVISALARLAVEKQVKLPLDIVNRIRNHPVPATAARAAKISTL